MKAQCKSCFSFYCHLSSRVFNKFRTFRTRPLFIIGRISRSNGKDKSGAGFFQRKHQWGNPYWLRGNRSNFFSRTGSPEFTKKHLLIHYHIYSGDAERVMEKLNKGLIDFGLLVGPTDISKYDYIRLPMKDLWGVLMRKDSPLAEKETISAEDLWDKPLIISHQASINSEMFSWLKTDLAKLNIVATYDLVYNAAQFVKKGFGYVIALDKLINTTGNSNLCFKPLFPTLEAELCIVWKKYQVLSKASNTFLQQLQQELENL